MNTTAARVCRTRFEIIILEATPSLPLGRGYVNASRLAKIIACSGLKLRYIPRMGLSHQGWNILVDSHIVGILR
jgi:hypothetical protein